MSKRGRKCEKYTQFLLDLIKESFLDSFVRKDNIYIPPRDDTIYTSLQNILKKNCYEKSSDAIYFCVLRHSSEIEQELFERSLLKSR